MEVVCHPYIVGELSCGNIKNRVEFLALLQALPMVPVITQEEFLHFVDSHKLMGKGVGFVDVHLLASSLLTGIPLWTQDTKLRSAATKLKLLYS
jgi:predicted nucleic acid-binding protein